MTVPVFVRPLLQRHRFRQVARLIGVFPHDDRGVIGEHLDRRGVDSGAKLTLMSGIGSTCSIVTPASSAARLSPNVKAAAVRSHFYLVATGLARPRAFSI
jgi:hypothetical protein